MTRLEFHPLPGLSSRHLQTIVAAFLYPGKEPPSQSVRVLLDDKDELCCEVSTPPEWTQDHKSALLVHGVGGCHESPYMIRIARKLYSQGIRAIRVNLRGCGTGKGLSKLPYNAGSSRDVLAVIKSLDVPAENLDVIGFSCGGNIVLKLAGELGSDASAYVHKFIAICPPLDLLATVRRIEQMSMYMYHRYYLKKMCEQAMQWRQVIARSVYDFDSLFTSRLWGYAGASDYYESNSSIHFLPNIAQTSYILFAEDDPLIEMHALATATSAHIQVYTTSRGGHLGFLSDPRKSGTYFWLDQLLLRWIHN